MFIACCTVEKESCEKVASCISFYCVLRLCVQWMKSKAYNKVATLPAICGSALVHDYFFGAGPKIFIPATTVMYGALGSENDTNTL